MTRHLSPKESNQRLLNAMFQLQNAIGLIPSLDEAKLKLDKAHKFIEYFKKNIAYKFLPSMMEEKKTEEYSSIFRGLKDIRHANRALDDLASAYNQLFFNVVFHQKFEVATRTFLEFFFDIVKRAHFVRFFPVGVISFDVDRLHEINEKYGKEKGGDTVIIAILDALRGEIRNENLHSTPGRRNYEDDDRREFPDFIAQIFSGDEFAVIMPRAEGFNGNISPILKRAQSAIDGIEPIPLRNLRSGAVEEVQPCATCAGKIMAAGESIFDLIAEMEKTISTRKAKKR